MYVRTCTRYTIVGNPVCGRPSPVVRIFLFYVCVCEIDRNTAITVKYYCAKRKVPFVYWSSIHRVILKNKLEKEIALN